MKKCASSFIRYFIVLKDYYCESGNIDAVNLFFSALHFSLIHGMSLTGYCLYLSHPQKKENEKELSYKRKEGIFCTHTRE